MLNCADLFAGAGGFSLAAQTAGFRVRLAIENNKHAIATYRANLCKGKSPPKICEGDITTMSPSQRGLEDLDLEGLRDVWRKRYGAPPMLRSCDLLRHLLAWRLQTERLGGLNLRVRQLLRRKSSTVRPKAALTVGTRLSREWRGRRYDVVSTEDGFAYDGQGYKSLSEVARAITGVRWNGPRFFGLRGGVN